MRLLPMKSACNAIRTTVFTACDFGAWESGLTDMAAAWNFPAPRIVSPHELEEIHAR